MKFFVLPVLLLLLSSDFILPQNRPDSLNTESGWLQAGLGFSGAKFQNSKTGFLFGLGGTIKSGDNLISLRFNKNTEITIFGPDPPGEIWTLEALYGRAFAFSNKRAIIPIIFPIGLLFKGNFNCLFNISAGISYVSLKERTPLMLTRDFLNSTYDYKITGRFGVPVELELINWFSRNFALGTGVYSNINGGKIFVGFRENVYIGIF
ncbi:MAG TPA: hypothetical protein VHO03_16250 [Ignavibacteriales bacterium]|nr:hypothetical protein [Ignavibacteriales bacterium]